MDVKKECLILMFSESLAPIKILLHLRVVQASSIISQMPIGRVGFTSHYGKCMLFPPCSGYCSLVEVTLKFRGLRESKPYFSYAVKPPYEAFFFF